MPKDRRMRSSLSFDQSRTTLYPCNRRNAFENKPGKSADDVKQWEDVRCPICMEPPHNALLLQCSSFEKGCRPYICDTSYRHSNCFDQFSKLLLSTARPGEMPPMSMVTRPEEIPFGNICPTAARRRAIRTPPRRELWGEEDQEQPKLVCPLCRGDIYGCIKVKDVRDFLNTKVRSCSNGSCGFSGTYSELRKHARTEHPDVQPTEVDLVRRRDWERLEEEANFEDLVSTMEVLPGEEDSDQLEIEIDLNDFFDCLFADAYVMLEASVEMFHSHNRTSRRTPRFRRDDSASGRQRGSEQRRRLPERDGSASDRQRRSDQRGRLPDRNSLNWRRRSDNFRR